MDTVHSFSKVGAQRGALLRSSGSSFLSGTNLVNRNAKSSVTKKTAVNADKKINVSLLSPCLPVFLVENIQFF